MRSTFKILFYINRQKTKTDGKTAILCRITIDGKSSAITTGEECLPAEWNAKQGQTTDKRKNKKLTEFRELVEKTYRDLLTRDRVVSVELIKNRLQGIATHPTTLLAMSKAELQSVKECVGKSKAESTYQNLCYSDKLLCEFVKDKGVITITEDLFEEYRFYLKKQGLAAATINRYLCWLSRLMYRAVSQRLIRCNPFENTKYEKTEQKIRFLQKSDVAKLMALKVNDKEARTGKADVHRRLLYRLGYCRHGASAIWTYPNGSGRAEVYPQGTAEDKNGVCRALASDSRSHHRTLQG